MIHCEINTFAISLLQTKQNKNKPQDMVICKKTGF